RAWRYNNPGYVRCSSRSTYYGALGCDGEFAIFPNYSTGLNAMRLSLQDEYPGHLIGDALRQHLPPEAGVDPQKLCEEAGLDPATKTEDVTPEDFGGMGPALESKPGWEPGSEFDRDAMDNPSWVETAWDAPATETGVSDPGNADASPATDNS